MGDEGMGGCETASEGHLPEAGRTHALTHSRTHALTHSRTHALTHSRYFSRFATKFSVAKSATLRVKWISSPATIPVYSIGTALPWYSNASVKETVSPFVFTSLNTT